MTAEYSLAVHGLVYLMHTARITTSEELAENICTNPARVRKVMAKLKSAGFVSSSEGKGSGYRAVENVGEITLHQVMKALGENVITVNWRSGNIDMECLVASGMSGIMDRIYSEMNGICKGYLGNVTIGMIHDEIFEELEK